MKFNFDIANKKAEVEVEAERLVEKGMEQHEKNWKNKFSTKHKAKKEIKELEHKQKVEFENIKQKKINWYQRMQEEKRKNKELEFQHNIYIIKIIGIAFLIMFIFIGIMAFLENLEII